eukprot:3117763-Pyramimonas_sp.AAC.1
MVPLQVTEGLLKQSVGVAEAVELSRAALMQLDKNSNVIRLHHAELRTAISGGGWKLQARGWKSQAQ